MQGRVATTQGDDLHGEGPDVDSDERGIERPTYSQPYSQPYSNVTSEHYESEFVKILLRRKRFPGRNNATRLVELQKLCLLPYSTIPWQSFIAATISSSYNTSIALLSSDQLAVPAHNVIVVQPWHFSDNRETSMSIASTITALRSFGWCADSFSYRDLLSVDSLLSLYARTRNHSDFAHMRRYTPQSQRSKSAR